MVANFLFFWINVIYDFLAKQTGVPASKIPWTQPWGYIYIYGNNDNNDDIVVRTV